MLDKFPRRAGPIAALIVTLGAGLAAPVIGEDASSSSAAPAAPAPTTTMSGTDLLAGKHIWSDAACFNCHGQNGQGGHSADFPAGPSLRASALDPLTMLQVVECGLPGTKMPAWLKGAYTEISCFGNPTGPAPADVLLSAAFSEEDLKNLIAYVQVNLMKKPMPDWSAAQ
jgi:mono/diheme cytochrome c family protein